MRRHKNLAADLAGLGSYIPWWLGLMLAIVAHVVFHTLTLAEAPGSEGVMARVAGIAQYLVPALLIFGSAVSYARGLHDDD